MFRTYIFHWLSGLKIMVWVCIWWFSVFLINPIQDLTIAIISTLMSSFFIARWLSFFIFWWYKRLTATESMIPYIIKPAYQTSMLFSIYILINMIALLWHNRSIGLWCILLCTFCIIQMLLVPAYSDHVW